TRNARRNSNRSSPLKTNAAPPGSRATPRRGRLAAAGGRAAAGSLRSLFLLRGGRRRRPLLRVLSFAFLLRNDDAVAHGFEFLGAHQQLGMAVPIGAVRHAVL